MKSSSNPPNMTADSLGSATKESSACSGRTSRESQISRKIRGSNTLPSSRIRECSHPHSQITATPFVPRRIKYELHASSEWYEEKERCVFCDIVRQEERLGKRIVDVQGDYYALCPYAARVPYEIWLILRSHNHVFEQPRPGANRRNLAALLGRTLRR